MNERIIGILGGMGPEATANLFMKIIRSTKAERDQDHFRVIIDNNPKIPDRTAAILGKGESPVNAMVQTGRNLEQMGVDIALIPCNTAHYFIQEVQSQLSIPLLNALDALYGFLKEQAPHINRVGLLATTGTIETGLYQRYLREIQVIIPNRKTQEEKVMKAIYGESGIKGGNIGQLPQSLLKDACNELIHNHAEIIIAGCTEVGLALKPEDVSKPLIDPMDIVAGMVTHPNFYL